MSTRGTKQCNTLLRRCKRASGLCIRSATFRLVEEEDPIGFYLDAYTDAEDAFAVLDLVSDWLVDLSVNTGVHLHVIPLPQEAAALHVSK